MRCLKGASWAKDQGDSGRAAVSMDDWVLRAGPADSSASSADPPDFSLRGRASPASKDLRVAKSGYMVDRELE